MNKIVRYSLGPLPLHFHQYSFICKAFTLFLNVVLQHCESRLITVTAALLACLLWNWWTCAILVATLLFIGNQHQVPSHPNQRAIHHSPKGCALLAGTHDRRLHGGLPKTGRNLMFSAICRDKGPARSWKRFHVQIHDFYPPPMSPGT